MYYDGFKSFYPLKDIWQTNWDNWKQTFTLTWKNGGEFFRAVVGEGDHQEIALGEARPNLGKIPEEGIIAAYWGRSDVTGKAKALYKETRIFNAHHFIWGESFYG